MTDPNLTRRLSAILSADVQVNSRLMEDDEVSPVETITEYRETFASLITHWNGKGWRDDGNGKGL